MRAEDQRVVQLSTGLELRGCSSVVRCSTPACVRVCQLTVAPAPHLAQERCGCAWCAQAWCLEAMRAGVQACQAVLCAQFW
jgi:hypothetical protein